MPRARELNDVEKFYIENNREKTDSELASMMAGVSAKKVSEYKEALPEKVVDETTESIKEESDEERKKRLSSISNVGDFFAQRNGTTAMTEQVSEITDARKIVKGTEMSKEQYDKNNRGKIHKPKN